MAAYQLFCISDTSKIGLIHQLRQILVQLKQNQASNLSEFLPPIPSLKGFRMVILIKDFESLQTKLAKALLALESTDVPRFLPNEKILYSAEDLSQGKTIFLFPGFGSEYPSMLTGISSKFEVVSKWMSLFEDLLHGTDKNDSVSQDEWLESRIQQKGYGVSEGGPIGSIASLAFHDVLRALNIKCDAIIGHSNGENAALISSGILNFNSTEQLLKIVQLLSDFPQVKNEAGVYLAINNFSNTNLAELLKDFSETVFLAMNNCPGQHVVYVKNQARESVIEFIKKRFGLVFDLTTDHPYHTKAFEQSLDYLKQIYNQFEISKGHTPVYSCVNSSFFPDDEAGIRDLALRQWVEPVDFQATIKKAYEEGARTFIEVGPNNRLSGFVADTLRGKKFLLLNCSKESTSTLDTITEMCAKLWVNHHTVDLSFFTPKKESISVSNVLSVNSEAAITREKIFEAHQTLMQQFLKVNDSITKSFLNTVDTFTHAMNEEPINFKINDLLLSGNCKKTKTGIEFIGTLDLSTHKLMNDHSMGGKLPVVPFTVSLELLAEVATHLIEPQNDRLSVFDASGKQWLDFEKSKIELKINAQFIVNDENAKIVEVKVFNVTDQLAAKIPAFEGKVTSVVNLKKESEIEIGSTKNRATISMSDFYKNHLFHGTCFESIHLIDFWNEQGVEAQFKMPDLSSAIEGISAPEFQIPGPMLDSTGQLMAYWLYELGMKDYAIFPFHLGSFDQYCKFPPAGSFLNCKAKISKDATVITGNFEFLDDQGTCIGRLTDFRLRIFVHDWIPPLLMNQINNGNPETLTADFLSEGGGIWKKIMGKLTLNNQEYDQWLKRSEADQINDLLDLELFKTSSIER